jgi:hypothetical protein
MAFLVATLFGALFGTHLIGFSAFDFQHMAAKLLFFYKDLAGFVDCALEACLAITFKIINLKFYLYCKSKISFIYL